MPAASTPPVADGWYSLVDGTRDLGAALTATPAVRRLPAGLLRWSMSRSFTRGVLLFAASIAHPAVAVTREDPGWGTVLALRALFGRRRKLIVMQFIRHQRRHPLRRLLYAYDRWAIRRTLLRGHALSQDDAVTLRDYYGLAPEQIVYVPWPLSRDAPATLPEAPAEPLVVCAGRAYCDWDTVFAAAAGAGWPLTVVCGRPDRRRVEQLAGATGATVRCELPRDEFVALIGRATVSIVALAERRTSAGHIRIADARTHGVALVVTATSSVRDYVRDGETALVVDAGDAPALRAAVDRLLADDALREGLRVRAHAESLAWRDHDYLAALGAVIHGYPAVLPAGAPGAPAPALV